MHNRVALHRITSIDMTDSEEEELGECCQNN